MAVTTRVIWMCACVRYWPYRVVGTCASVHNLVSFPLPLNIAPYIYLCIGIQVGKRSITIQRHCNFFSIGWLFKSKVCYDKYGCFDRHPNLLVRFPQEPSKLLFFFEHLFSYLPGKTVRLRRSLMTAM